MLSTLPHLCIHRSQRLAKLQFWALSHSNSLDYPSKASVFFSFLHSHIHDSEERVNKKAMATQEAPVGPVPDPERDSANAMEEAAVGPEKVRFNKYSLLCALLASTNSILLGYDIGVMSGAAVLIKEDLNISMNQEQLLIGILNVCSLIGSLASGKTSDQIGRRYTIVLAAVTFLAGALLMGLAPSYPCLMAGRMVAGIGVGYSLMIAPVYTAEIAPAKFRGFLTSLPEVLIVFGILLGYIVNYALTGIRLGLNWRLMLGVASIPALFIGLGVLTMPESPRWLIMKGRAAEARKVLKKISYSEEEANFRLTEILKAASSSDPSSDNNNWSGKGVWKELLLRPSRPVRRMLVAAMGINFFMQASGNDAVIYYGPEVFKEAGLGSTRKLFGVNVIMGLSKMFFVLLSASYLDRFGRRPLLLLGSAGIVISLLVLGYGCKILQHSADKPTWAMVLCIVAVCAFVSFFSIGLGPITWVYSSEIFPLRLRAQGSALSISVNRLVSGVTSMTFLTMAQKLTLAGIFFMFAGIMTVGTVFFYFCMPETKGKTLEEIESLFEEKYGENSRGTGEA